MVPVARRNLFAEKARFAISVAGVAFAVLLILIVVALYRGWSRSGEVFEELPGQLWVVQAGTSDPFHSVSLLTEEDVASAAAVPGVEAAVPVLSRQMNIEIDGEEESVRMLALAVPEGVDFPPDFAESYAPPPGEIIIEKILSRQTGLGEGDVVDIQGVELRVGRVRPKGGDVISQFAFLNFEDARTIFGVHGIVTYTMLILREDASVDEVAELVAAADSHVQVYTSSEFARAVRKEIDETFIPVIAILVAIGFIVGAAVVGLTIYTATIERAREFGVMKAVGASPAFLYRIVLSQSGILVAAGFVTGVLAAMGTARIAEQIVPEFATDFQLRDIMGVLAAAAAMSLVASFVPVRRINSIDPAVVFRA